MMDYVHPALAAQWQGCPSHDAQSWVHHGQVMEYKGLISQLLEGGGLTLPLPDAPPAPRVGSPTDHTGGITYIHSWLPPTSPTHRPTDPPTSLCNRSTHSTELPGAILHPDLLAGDLLFPEQRLTAASSLHRTTVTDRRAQTVRASYRDSPIVRSLPASDHTLYIIMGVPAGEVGEGLHQLHAAPSQISPLQHKADSSPQSHPVCCPPRCALPSWITSSPLIRALWEGAGPTSPGCPIMCAEEMGLRGGSCPWYLITDTAPSYPVYRRTWILVLIIITWLHSLTHNTQPAHHHLH